MNSEILKIIRKSRLSKEKSQKEIAEKLNISVPSYSRFENGITKTDYQLILKVCEILEIDALTIFLETVPDRKNESIELSNQLKELVLLLEKQNEINALILQKILKLKLAC